MSETPEPKPEQPQGIVCPRCGCGHFWTLDTRRHQRKIVRRRECRHCGKRITTTERIVGS